MPRKPFTHLVTGGVSPEAQTLFDRDMDAWAKARGLRPHTQELEATPTQAGTYGVAEYEFAGEPLTVLTIPTPEPFVAADWERAKRRAQFPANRKGERAFLAAERKR